MNQFTLRRATYVAAAICSILTTAAEAGLLTPNGNPSGGNPGPYVETFYQYNSVLYPTPAAFVAEGSCAWILPALQAQGYTKSSGWTINTQTLQGDLELDIYRPWVVFQPALTQGDLTWSKSTRPDFGGANIGIKYLPSTKVGSTDPTGSGIGWIQVIHTDQPTGFGKAWGVNEGNGYWNYIDNGLISNPDSTFLRNSPIYPGASNSTDFADGPARLVSTFAHWQAQVFLASYAPINSTDRTMGGTITLYDGVWWGFSLAAPEPSTLVLAVFGLVILGLVGQRKKYRRA